MELNIQTASDHAALKLSFHRHFPRARRLKLRQRLEFSTRFPSHGQTNAWQGTPSARCDLKQTPSCSLGDFPFADRTLCVCAGAHRHHFLRLPRTGARITTEVLLVHERRHRSHLADCSIANTPLLGHRRSSNIFSRDLARARTGQLGGLGN